MIEQIYVKIKIVRIVIIDSLINAAKREIIKLEIQTAITNAILNAIINCNLLICN